MCVCTYTYIFMLPDSLLENLLKHNFFPFKRPEYYSVLAVPLTGWSLPVWTWAHPHPFSGHVLSPWTPRLASCLSHLLSTLLLLSPLAPEVLLCWLLSLPWHFPSQCCHGQLFPWLPSGRLCAARSAGTPGLVGPQ